MIKLLQTFTNNIQNISMLEDADAALLKLLHSELGCEELAYTGYAQDYWSSKKLYHQLMTPGLKAWHQYYVEHQFEALDPYGDRVRESLVPLRWSVQQQLRNADDNQKQIYQTSIEHGFDGSGVSIPLHGPRNQFAILTIHSKDIDAFLDSTPDLLHTIHQAGIYYHSKVLELLSEQLNQQHKIELTDREKQCLIGITKHKTIEVIADELNIKPRTISFHLENCIKKLKVNNKYQAADMALKLNLLH